MLSLVVLLTSCASTKPQPQGGDLTLTDTSPDEVRQSSATGSAVRWGGTITGIKNLEDGTTSVELVSRPLQKNGRPIRNDKTEGRFIADTSEFLDPAIIKVGRDLTVVGTVSDVREGKVGEATYQFPVVTVDDYRYWNARSRRSQAYYPSFYGHSRFGFDPFFRDSPFRSHRRFHRRSGASASFLFIH